MAIRGIKIGENQIDVMRNKLFIWMALLLFSACSSGVVYESKVTFDANGWHKDSIAFFDVPITDTASVYTIGLTLDHSKNYAYSNLWLFLSIENQEDAAVCDTVEFFVARPNGNWLGSKKKGGFEVSAYYKQGVKMMQPGIYRFGIQQGMREPLLKEVTSIELWMQ